VYGVPKPQLQAVKTIVVSASGLTMQKLDDGSIKIKNSLDDPVDVSGWKLFSNGMFSAFPEFSMIAANATITIDLATFGLPAANTLTLATPQGTIMATTQTQAVPVQSNSVRGSTVLRPVSVPTVEPIRSDSLASVSPITNQIESKKQRRTGTAIAYGAALITILVLFILLERFMAKRE
jgi:hypothetical protein